MCEVSWLTISYLEVSYYDWQQETINSKFIDNPYFLLREIIILNIELIT